MALGGIKQKRRKEKIYMCGLCLWVTESPTIQQRSAHGKQLPGEGGVTCMI